MLLQLPLQEILSAVNEATSWEINPCREVGNIGCESKWKLSVASDEETNCWSVVSLSGVRVSRRQEPKRCCDSLWPLHLPGEGVSDVSGGPARTPRAEYVVLAWEHGQMKPAGPLQLQTWGSKGLASPALPPSGFRKQPGRHHHPRLQRKLSGQC